MTVTVRHRCAFCHQPCGPDTQEEYSEEAIRMAHGEIVSHGICPECYAIHFPINKPEDKSDG